MTTYFTADTHFGHANIIKPTYCDRPFKNIDEMDTALIDNINRVVQPNDTLYHLGDFCRDGRHIDRYLSRINCINLHLHEGNHDDKYTLRHPRWKSVKTLSEIYVGKVKLILCHYSLRVWNKSHYGSLMLYGHSHSGLPGDDQTTDVGVDMPFTNYSPVSLEQIKAFLRTQPKRTLGHHDKT